ncbi:CPBP family intramembrane metalloprotease [Candidatus Saccharibacteria bacterium]|nr:CPBP family intramembrane metalloprotease [Candidatus Saccharibacteria bacterium]
MTVHQPHTTQSPLSLVQAIKLLAILLVLTIAFFGIVVVLLLNVPAVRSHAFAVLAWTVPVLSVVLVTTLYYSFRQHALRWNDIGLRSPSLRLFHLIWQIPVMLVALVVTQIIVFLIFQVEPTSNNRINNLLVNVDIISAGALFIGVSFLVPFWEEVVFRGLIYGGLRRKYRVMASLLLAAVIFACAHAVPILLPYMIIVGLSLGLIYEFHRTLWASIIAHTAINTLVAVPLLLTMLT